MKSLELPPPSTNLTSIEKKINPDNYVPLQFYSERPEKARKSPLEILTRYSTNTYIFRKRLEGWSKLVKTMYELEKKRTPGRKRFANNPEQNDKINDTSDPTFDVSNLIDLKRLGYHMQIHALVGDTADGVSDSRSIPYQDWKLFEQAIENNENNNKGLTKEDFYTIVAETINLLRSSIYAQETKYFTLEQECHNRKQMVDRGVHTIKDLENTLPTQYNAKLAELLDKRELIVQKIRHLMWLGDQLQTLEQRSFVVQQILEFRQIFNIQDQELDIDMGTHAGLMDSEYRPAYSIKGIKQFAHLNLPNHKHIVPREFAPIYKYQQILDSLNRADNLPSQLPTTPQMNLDAKF